MAMVPDLGSDFAQRLLVDLRRRRERLGFESSSSSQQQQRTPPRDACSNSQRPLRNQKPQQRAPAPGARRPPESTTTTQRPSHQQQGSSGNAIAMAGKPRRRRADIVAADAHAIVPFQGGGGGGARPKPSVDVQMAALALALSSNGGGGKLRRVELVARNGSVFFRDPDMAAAIGVRELNEMLMAYSNSSGGRRRSSAAMNLEESLSMLVMLQDASGYAIELRSGTARSGGSGKVLLLKGKENRKSSLSPSSSARIVEIVDEDSDAEQAKDRKTSTQIVAYNSSQGYQSPTPNSSSAMASSAAGSSNSKINGASEGEKDGSKVRMPSVIAKLMGLDNLPSSSAAPAKAVPERKGTEKFVRPEALPRKEIRANSMDRKLPIRIVSSEKASSKGQHKILLAGDWKTGVTNYGEFEFANALSNSPSHPAHGGNKQVRQTMGQVLRKMVGTEQGDDDERITHEDKAFAEEIKVQIPVNIGSRSDAGKKTDFLKRFRKSSESRPAMEDKHITEEKSAGAGKKQDTIIKRLLGRDSETKSRRAREKINKENLAVTETNAAGKNGRTDQMKRQAQNKHTDRKITRKKAQSCRKTQTETPAQNLEDKKPVMSEAPHMRKKLEYTIITEQENGEHTEVNDTVSFSKPSDSTHGDVVGFSEQLAIAVTRSITTEAASLDQALQDITEETNDPTTIDVDVVQESEDSKFLDQTTTVEMMNDGRIDHRDSETTQIPETFAEEEQHQQQQQQQQMIVKDQLTDGPDHTTKSTDPTVLQDHKTHVVSCDSFTESQLLLMQLLLKDRYLLETAKSIIKVDAPVDLAVNAGARNWSDKCNGLLSDVTQEVTRRKAKRTEAMEGVAGSRKLRYLDDLVRELDGDIESLDTCRRPHRPRDEDGTAEILGIMLERDIENNHPDADSTWDYGWDFRVSGLPVEKNEVVRDLEKNILGGIITDVVRDLVGVSVRHGCCPCVD